MNSILTQQQIDSYQSIYQPMAKKLQVGDLLNDELQTPLIYTKSKTYNQ